LRLVRRRGAVDTTAPALTITTLVLVAAETGALQDAAVLYGSVEQNLASAETVMTPEWLRRFRAAILTCRRGLGIRRFDQARERGHRLSSAQAVAEAIAFAQTIHAGADVQPTSALDTLTRRERQVLELLARGYSNAGIAAQLDLSVKTVMHHTSAIYRKLGLRGRAEAIAAAFDAGLV
jgi:ATP/maltotriose-dependent transcriptional regulator MalT